MKNKNSVNTRWFSVIVSLLIIWFLLVLTTGIYNLILKELYDNRDMWNAIKAYAWAESAQELALLEIKEKGYWYDTQMVKSNIISNNVLISYNIGTKVNTYNWNILSWDYDIIPLFYINENGEEKKVWDIVFKILWSSNPDDLVWSLISSTYGISWKWESPNGIKKIFWSLDTFSYNSENISSFLSSHKGIWDDPVYFILFNSWDQDIQYKISSNEFFSKPKTEIISSATAGKVKQNLWTTLNNTEYLNLLKYAIYSN